MDDQALIDLFGEEISARDKAAKLSARQQDDLTEAFRALLATEPGKKILWWLLNQTHVFQSSFTGNSQTFFLEGERAVGLKLYNQLLMARPTALQELINYRRGVENE